jgi:hypothetical protein
VFIGGSDFLGALGAKERFQPPMNTDERRWSERATLSEEKPGRLDLPSFIKVMIWDRHLNQLV